ncbi:hypothetical protein Glove_227g50 [Diversispora epigaea]|uniref:alpha-1,2-Mannosidase n=1 Tax=Diversispora epigaea TaxID=1348612 RepID=A0A397ILY6_9GLOM|nr:hypothetical protein Glove_227g50 [Diversispora epigaea]
MFYSKAMLLLASQCILLLFCWIWNLSFSSLVPTLMFSRDVSAIITEKRRIELRNLSKEMFYHGFNNYMKYAFPEDELDPINCVGRGSDKKNPNNVLINDVLGDFSLTLIDSLDSFVVFNDKAEFETAVRNVIKHVSFDQNNRVQVFEANIRVLGALLSAHLFATDSRFGFKIEGYNNELLDLAYDLGQRLLPAFQNTETGIPYARVNLKHGVMYSETHETCTAGAGTFILEFGVLSRLKNDTRFEDAARRALFGLWDRRTDLDLVGNVINIQTGQWIHTAASTGAGIDSFYEYLLKAYVLFGETEYLDIFNEAYAAILKHVRDESGYLYRNVNMMNGGLMSSWVDSLSAFFPGLQVFSGDLDTAIKSHLFYFNIWRKYRAIPERFNFYLKNVEISSYPLRPEFIESTYLLYQATKDPFYLQVGEMVLQDLESISRVECGYASIKNVFTKKLDDRMESFALSETFKYLYLLFDTDNFLNKLDDNFVFTTEAHIIPLPVQYLKKTKRDIPRTDNFTCQAYQKKQTQLAASITNRPDADFARELVGLEEISLPPLDPHGYCEIPETDPLVIGVSFTNSDPDSQRPFQQLIQYVNGIIANSLAGLKLELTRRADRKGYDVTKVDNMRILPGQIFEIRDPAIKQTWVKQQTYETSIVRVFHDSQEDYSDYIGAIASFGPQITEALPISYLMKIPLSSNGCKSYKAEKNIIKDKILFVKRGGCTFVEKVSNAQAAGAKALLVASDDNILFRPVLSSEFDETPYSIPCILITNESGMELDRLLSKSSDVRITLMPDIREPSTYISNDSNNELLLVIHGRIIRNVRLNFNGQ